VSLIPPGWYPDPRQEAAWRWWDGTTWTFYTHTPVLPMRSRARGLPWKPWLASVGVSLVVGGVLIGHAESTRTPNPGVWYAAGFASVAAIVLITAALTLGRKPWLHVAAFAAIAAIALGLVVFTTSAPSSSRSCQNAGQPQSAGTYDCDTSFGFGMPFLVVVFFVPAMALATLGKVGADTYVSVRKREKPQASEKPEAPR